MQTGGSVEVPGVLKWQGTTEEEEEEEEEEAAQLYEQRRDCESGS